MQMKGQAAQVRVAGSLSKSADVMKAMQQLVKVPEIQKTMQEMSKEMMKVCFFFCVFMNMIKVSNILMNNQISTLKCSIHSNTLQITYM